jgi:hypothetical protein
LRARPANAASSVVTRASIVRLVGNAMVQLIRDEQVVWFVRQRCSHVTPHTLFLWGRRSVFDLTGGNVDHQLGGLAKVSRALATISHSHIPVFQAKPRSHW